MPPKPENLASRPPTDWFGILAAGLMLAWMMAAARGLHLVAWLIEQFGILTGAGWPLWAWLLVGLFHFGMIAGPAGLLAALWPRPRYRAVFQTWFLAGVFVLFMLPVRLAPMHAQQPAALLQIVFSSLFIAGLIAVLHWRGARLVPGSPAFLPAMLLAPLLLLGWLAWGALGSLLDSLLNLLAGLLFGLACGLVLGNLLLPALDRTEARPVWNILLGGFAINGTLAIMGVAFGFNGSQLILTFALASLGWAAIGLAYLGWGDRVSDEPAEHAPEPDAHLAAIAAAPATPSQQGIERSWPGIALLVGLVTAGILMFHDPDELILVLNLGTRDVLAWSLRANLVTLVSGWAFGLLLLALHSLLPRLSRRILLVSCALVWTLAATVYFLAGQPGFFGERYFVILRDQAALAGAPAIENYQERRQFVYRSLTEHADASQAGLRQILERWRVPYTPYYLVNAIEVSANPLLRLALALHPDVDRVLDSPVLRPLPLPPPQTLGLALPAARPPWNLVDIGADRVWDEFGITGTGIVVGQSDSGVQGDHPELAAAYRGANGQHDYNWYDPWNASLEPVDIGGHGTHTLGSIVGESVGVAPGATWYGCVNLARNLANPALYLECLQFMLAPFPPGGNPFADGDPARGAHVINNSWGCPAVIEGCDANALIDGVRALRAAGVFVVASAGNDGDACETVADPIAIYDQAFTVGAVDRRGELAVFSSRGPVTADGSERIKPDIVAPGVDVLSAYPGGSYELASGTSMAGPHVVGVVALLWSANPALIGDIEATERILVETAQPYDFARFGTPPCSPGQTHPNNAAGFGIVDAYAAVRRALETPE